MGREKGRCKLSALLGSRVITGAPQWADPFTLPSPPQPGSPGQSLILEQRCHWVTLSVAVPLLPALYPLTTVPALGSFQAPGWLQFFTDWWECSQGKSSPQCWAWAAQFVVHQLSTLLAALALLWLP